MPASLGSMLLRKQLGRQAGVGAGAEPRNCQGGAGRAETLGCAGFLLGRRAKWDAEIDLDELMRVP